MTNFYSLLKSLCTLVTVCIATIARAQPVNNNCDGAIQITMNAPGSCAATTTVNTTGATYSGDAGIHGQFCAASSGNDDVWYTFTTHPTQTSAVLSITNLNATSGTAASAGYAVYSGTCNTLTQIACSSTGLKNNVIISDLSAATTYYLRVWAAGAANAATFNLCMQQPLSAPGCATSFTPLNNTVAPLLCGPGPSSVAFTWSAPANGTAPAGYKVFIGTNVPEYISTIPGTSVFIYNLLPSTTYHWYVVPTTGNDAAGCDVPLTFTTTAEPACVGNNSCAAATIIGSNGSAGTQVSTTAGATISKRAEACNGATGTADDDVWFSFITDNDGGDVSIALTNAAANLDAVMHAYSGTCGNLTNIGSADESIKRGANETLNLTGLSASTIYYIRVYGYGLYNSTVPTGGAFTITTSGTGVEAVAMPVILTALQAKLQNEDAVLTWQTSQEVNNKGFEIQKSYDALNFTPIGFVNGAGSSSIIKNYSFADKKIRAGLTIYYRLKQVDNDGKTKLTNTVNVRLIKSGVSTAFIYPNPAHNAVNITFNKPVTGKTTISIINAKGQVLLTQPAVQGAVSIPVNIAAFAAGTYFIKIVDSYNTQQLQFIKN